MSYINVETKYLGELCGFKANGMEWILKKRGKKKTNTNFKGEKKWEKKENERIKLTGRNIRNAAVMLNCSSFKCESLLIFKSRSWYFPVKI